MAGSRLLSGNEKLRQKQNNYLIIYGNQKNRQNQFLLILIYHEEKLYPNLDYFIRKKSDYVLGFGFMEIINSIF
jgi:hypothetical protein